MNAGELIDLTRTLAGMPNLPPAHVLTLLNVANDEVSRDARVPIGTVNMFGLTTASQLQVPQDGREEGLMAVYHVRRNEEEVEESVRELRLLSFRAASELYPGWTTWGEAESPTFVVYDPPQLFNDPLPVPGPSAEHVHDYRLVYLIRPCKMETMTDKPLDGKHASFHDALAYRAAFLLTRDRDMRAEYELKIRRMRRFTQDLAPRVFNPLWNEYARVGGR